MDKKEINARFRKLAKLKTKRDALDAEIKEIENSIKDYMTESEIDELFGTDHKALWTTYEKSSFDTKKFRAEHPKLAMRYTSVNTQRRFTFA